MESLSCKVNSYSISLYSPDLPRVNEPPRGLCTIYVHVSWDRYLMFLSRSTDHNFFYPFFRRTPSTVLTLVDIPA